MNTIAQALEDLRQGKMIIVCDDEGRENEGDFIMAAELATPEAINFMAQVGRGIVCTPLTALRAQELELNYMVEGNTSAMGTPFTVSVDLKEETSTGISARDRALTVQALCRPDLRPDQLTRPGHIFPLVARDGGVLEREGHTEAAVDLTRLAGLTPVGVICEIMNPDGTMARVPQLERLAAQFDLKMITISDLITYRKQHEGLYRQTSQVRFPNLYGEFSLRHFENSLRPEEEHLAIVKGNPQGKTLVRLHSECLTGDVFGSLRCDCGEQLAEAMQLIERQGEGVIIYMRQEGRGIGLKKKLQAYELQENGHDTVSANLALGHAEDEREFYAAAQILKQLGIEQVELLSNNPRKGDELERYGITVEKLTPLEVGTNPHNAHYLMTKKEKLGHHLNFH